MHDDLTAGHNEGEAPVADRRVGGVRDPVMEPGVRGVPAPEPVHRWLDGESVAEGELAVPQAERLVKFWARVLEETQRRRQLMTPAHLPAVIMEKLEPPVVKDD